MRSCPDTDIDPPGLGLSHEALPTASAVGYVGFMNTRFHPLTFIKIIILCCCLSYIVSPVERKKNY